MTATFAYYRPGLLPWTVSPEEEARFRRILKRVLLVCLLFSLIMPWLPVPKVDRSKEEELPPRLAKLLLERQPAPPPVVVKKPEPEVAAKPQPEVTKPEPKKPPVTEARKPEPAKAPGERIEAARRRASGVGLLAMKNELADLRGAPVAAQFQKDIKPGPGVGSGSGPGVGAGKSPGLPSRALIASNATRGSGGINTGSLSRDTGGGGLAGRSTTAVEGVMGGDGGGGAGGGGTVRRGGSGKASRSIEDIKLIFDRNKGSIYAIYNRALREDPTLQGKVVVKLTIAPSGQVLDCQLVSSELRSPDLERKLLVRIKQFDFGAKAVDAMVVTYPIDFLPS
ncbi:MAG TPA: TonB family protein [Burkholderiales bacterium]